MKHIEINYQVVCEKLNTVLLKLLLVSSPMQAADILTKPLPPTLFSDMHFKLGMKNIYSRIEGGGGLNSTFVTTTRLKIAYTCQRAHLALCYTFMCFSDGASHVIHVFFFFLTTIY